MQGSLHKLKFTWGSVQAKNCLCGHSCCHHCRGQLTNTTRKPPALPLPNAAPLPSLLMLLLFQFSVIMQPLLLCLGHLALIATVSHEQTQVLRLCSCWMHGLPCDEGSTAQIIRCLPGASRALNLCWGRIQPRRHRNHKC